MMKQKQTDHLNKLLSLYVNEAQKKKDYSSENQKDCELKQEIEKLSKEHKKLLYKELFFCYIKLTTEPNQKDHQKQIDIVKGHHRELLNFFYKKDEYKNPNEPIGELFGFVVSEKECKNETEHLTAGGFINVETFMKGLMCECAGFCTAHHHKICLSPYKTEVRLMLKLVKIQICIALVICLITVAAALVNGLIIKDIS